MFERTDDNETKLKKLKKCVENSYQSFLSNYERYNTFMKFVFKTNLSTDERTKLDELKKPPLEFNILESIVSRVRGDFSKHEPSIEVRASEAISVEELNKTLLKTIDIVEKHFRAIFNESNNDSLGYKIRTETIGGGYSAVYIYTDYINEMSFIQNIKIKKIFDPTLVGFDELARESHKGDGRFCFQLIPKTKEDVEEEFGKDVTKNIRFVKDTTIGSFNWSYRNKDVDVLLVCEFFYKVRKKEKLAKLSNGHTILFKHYDRLKEIWDNEGFIEQMPIVVDTRSTVVESVERIIFCEDNILSHDKTPYKYLPIVFIDGNSVYVKESQGEAASQVTRPLTYHAEGTQKLLNLAGQTIGAEIENMVMHKMVVAAESIPQDYVEAYKNVQIPSNYVYNAFYQGKVDQPLPPPREVQRTPTPPVIENVFNGSNAMVQAILGNYDGLLQTNDRQISGVAIQQGALQSSAAAQPYLMGYIQGLNRMGEIILDLIPKFYVTPRTIPIMERDGKRSYQIINQKNNPESINMQYDPNVLQVRIEAGVSTAVQKQVAKEEIIKMSQVNELFGAFITKYGLEIFVDNLDIRRVDVLKQYASEFMKEIREKEEEAKNNLQLPPELELQQQEVQAYQEIEQGKLQVEQMKIQGDLAIQAAKVANEKEALALKFLEVKAKLDAENRRTNLEEHKIAANDANTAVEHAIKLAEHQLKKETSKHDTK
jgi:hypothetical protein